MKLKLDENLGTLCSGGYCGRWGMTSARSPLKACRGPAIAKSSTNAAAKSDASSRWTWISPTRLCSSHRNISGIAVLPLPPRPDHADVLRIIETLGRALLTSDVQGNLWIVKEHRIRVSAGPVIGLAVIPINLNPEVIRWLLTIMPQETRPEMLLNAPMQYAPHNELGVVFLFLKCSVV